MIISTSSYRGGISSVSDYSAFGVQLENRVFEGEGFRYGFQNQEEDSETGLVNYKYRMHDPRLGRFFAIDPLTKHYPWYTPYSFSGNKVIAYAELEGLEEIQKYLPTENPESEIQVSNSESIFSNLCFENPNHTFVPLPPEIAKSIGTVFSLGGTIVTGAGYVCVLIPIPQTQAASKFLIPAGNACSYVGTGLLVTDQLAEGDYSGAFKDITLMSVTLLTGQVLDNLYDASKVSSVDVNGINLLMTIEEPLLGEMVNPDQPENHTNNNSNSSENNDAKTSSTSPSPMYNYVQQFQKTKPASKKAKSQNSKSPLPKIIMSPDPIENANNAIKLF